MITKKHSLRLWKVTNLNQDVRRAKLPNEAPFFAFQFLMTIGIPGLWGHHFVGAQGRMPKISHNGILTLLY